MRSALSARLDVFLAVALAVTPSAAQSDKGGPSYSLSLVRGDGAEACPDGRELTREVERRLGRALFDSPAPRAFEVELDRKGGNFRSTVYVRSEDGQAIGQRTLESDEQSCVPIFAATVLAVALVIDPAAELAPSSPAVAAFAPTPSTSATNALTKPAPVAVPAPPSAPLPLVLGPTSRNRVVEVREASRKNSPAQAVAISARAMLSSSVVPAVRAGAALTFEARANDRWAILLGAAYLPPAGSSSHARALELGLTAATLEASYAVARGSLAEIELDAGTWAGALQASIESGTHVNSGPFPFLALTFGARSKVSISGKFFLDTGVAGLVPAVRRGFFVAPAALPVWREPALAGFGFFGLGMSFP